MKSIQGEHGTVRCPHCKKYDRVIDLGYEGRYTCNSCLLQFHVIDNHCGICGDLLFEDINARQSPYYCDNCVTNEGL